MIALISISLLLIVGCGVTAAYVESQSRVQRKRQVRERIAKEEKRRLAAASDRAESRINRLTTDVLDDMFRVIEKESQK